MLQMSAKVKPGSDGGTMTGESIFYGLGSPTPTVSVCRLKLKRVDTTTLAPGACP